MRLLQALSKRKDVKNVEFCHLHLEGTHPCTDPNQFFSSCFFIGKDQRNLVALGHGAYIPCFLSDIGKLMRQGIMTPDIAFIQVSNPDKHGFVSLGPEVAASLPAVETAKIVIAQINKNVPRTWGTSNISIQNIDYIVPDCNDELFQGHKTKIGIIEQKIGENIARLVPDGATLQMGIGAIPDAVLSGLHNHKDLGVHTEMLGEGFLPLLKSGAINNTKKKYLPGRSLASFALGSKNLYDFLDDNPSILFNEAGVTNNPRVIAKNPKVVAVNSVIEMDLTGQSCADSVGTRMISGVGGQLDFERGAALSEGGVPILCFASTDSKTKASKIVPFIREGGGIVTSRAHAHYVVTEYGVASLFGKNMHQRAKALIDIAHPDHQQHLEKEAFKRFKIRAWK